MMIDRIIKESFEYSMEIKVTIAFVLGWIGKFFLWIAFFEDAYTSLFAACTAFIPVLYGFIRLYYYAKEKKYEAEMNKVKLEKAKEELNASTKLELELDNLGEKH